MKIISWNTNGLRATVKQGNFTPLFAFNNPDIVCFQETKCEIDQLDEKTRNLKGYHSYFSHSKGRKGYSGVAMYTEEKLRRYFLWRCEYCSRSYRLSSTKGQRREYRLPSNRKSLDG